MYSHTYTDTFVQLYVPSFWKIWDARLCITEGGGGEGGVGWHQPGADIVPVAPLATPTPSVICANICKPKVPLSPNVRAVCLAFPLRKPGVIHQNKTY